MDGNSVSAKGYRSGHFSIGRFPSSGTEGAELLKRHRIELIIDNDKIAQKRVALEKLVQEILGVRR